MRHFALLTSPPDTSEGHSHARAPSYTAYLAPCFPPILRPDSSAATKALGPTLGIKYTREELPFTAAASSSPPTSLCWPHQELQSISQAPATPFHRPSASTTDARGLSATQEPLFGLKSDCRTRYPLYNWPGFSHRRSPAKIDICGLPSIESALSGNDGTLRSSMRRGDRSFLSSSTTDASGSTARGTVPGFATA